MHEPSKSKPFETDKQDIEGSAGRGMGMLAKGLSLLVALGAHPTGVGVSELAREVGLNVSTAYRLLISMVPMGFVRYDEREHKYSLGLKAFEMCHQAPGVGGLSAVAYPAIRRVADRTGESTSIAILEGTEMLVLGQAEGRQRIQIRLTAGQRGPLYATSLGKALLAFQPEVEQRNIVEQLELLPRGPNTIVDPAALREELQRVRELGYAIADEENEPGIRAVAVPVKNHLGRSIGAVSIAVPTLRSSVEALKEAVPVLQEAVETIEIELLRNEALLVDEEHWIRS
ncbi:MAG: IclR family transcriptional regulator [Rubrobacteraceae bacterium]